jgi:hypothetical protein
MLDNCTVSSNTAYFVGITPAGEAGGVYQCVLTNCTVTWNSANYLGGGTYGSTFYNCIVYFNTAPTNSNYDTSDSFNFCCTTLLPSGGLGNFTNAPVFADSFGHPQTNSPCIDAGNNAYTNSFTDLDGRPRVVNGTVDVGAYEFQGANLEPFIVWLDQYALPDDGSADYVDSDGTGMNNWQKWIAGLNPTNSASVLALQTLSLTTTNATITWQSVAGVNYFIQRSSDLGAQPPFSTIQSNIIGQASMTSYIDTNAVVSGKFFYRVGVQ